jgi:hypothetical protein
MPHHEEGPRLNRRELLRRGAVVGGTLLWAAPVVQSLSPAAYAFHAQYHSCCECNDPARGCHQDMFTLQECIDFCGPGGVRSFQQGSFNCIDGRCVPS